MHWNQLAIVDRVNGAVRNADNTYTISTLYPTTKQPFRWSIPNVVSGHIYYVSFNVGDTTNVKIGIEYAHVDNIWTSANYLSNLAVRTGVAFTSQLDSDERAYGYITRETTYKLKGSFTVSPIVVDLTDMFGEGYEPTAEEFREMFSAVYYPFNEGEWIQAPEGVITAYEGSR